MVKTPNSSRMEIGGGTLTLMIPFLCVKLRVEKVVFQKEFASVVCHAAQCLHSTGTGLNGLSSTLYTDDNSLLAKITLHLEIK